VPESCVDQQLEKANQFGTLPALHPIVMAFEPPANNAGVPIPAIPDNPPSLSDITNTKDYVERLIQSKGKCPLPDRKLEWDELICVPSRFQQLVLKFMPQMMR
jgi:hypothetical protein